jgi:ABC-type cobalamin transport system ATPase subunit
MEHTQGEFFRIAELGSEQDKNRTVWHSKEILLVNFAKLFPEGRKQQFFKEKKQTVLKACFVGQERSYRHT